MMSQEIFEARQLDAAWLISVWKAIHGGDPDPEAVAAELIAALAQYLQDSDLKVTFVQLDRQFAHLAMQ
jgi:hypothetical protein